MKSLILVALIASVGGNIIPQTWFPMGVPEGNGVTDLVYWSGGGAVFGDKLWATTGSVDWPTGQRGGVFYSAVSGTYQGIWYRLGGSAGYYVGRTLAVGQDGNLYASLWRDPATFPADALCRFVPQAALFGILYQAQAGDNIFSIAVKNNPHTIFGGTRNGVIRSTDNGATFGYSNTGIPDSAWVYDIAIDSSGILAIATSKGLFISEDNGDNWLTTTGIASEDTVVTINFVSDTTSDKLEINSLSEYDLYAGTKNGKIYGARRISYGVAFLLYAFVPDQEISDIKWLLGFALNSVFCSSRSTGSNKTFIPQINNIGGVYESTDDGTTWNQINNGLPANPPVSALTIKSYNDTYYELYAGLFNDSTGGAGVYKLGVTVDVEKEDNQTPTEFKLEQNYPNPFNPSTTIQFSIPEQAYVNIEIFNALGEKVTTLVSEELNTGNYKYDWDAGNLPSGIYLYRLQTPHSSISKKMTLIK